MEEIKAPKKERRFIKGLGEIALVLIRELVLGIGKKVINKVGNKREKLVIAIIILASSVAFAQYPATGNKQRLGYQTSGDGLVFRGRSNDTTALKPSSLNNAYHIFDTVNNVLFSYIKTKGGWKFNNSDTVIINGVTMPFDSITFNTAKDGTVGVGEVEYNDTQGSLIQGLKGGLVTNVIGQQLHQRVNNRTGATLAKGDVVYLSGSQGNRITVAKAIATSDPTSANTFGIVAESIADNQSGYVITEGLLTNINTSALTVDSAVYLSGTTAGALTSNKPQAPIHGVYIGVCVKSNAGSGEVFVKIRNGQELDELHDVQITNPTSNASLFYKSSEGLWRDTTAALLVSDTASMLTNYLRTGVAASTYTPLTRSISTTAPLQGGGDLSANRTFSITQASGSVNGFLSSTDWTTFNGKGNGTVTSVSGSGAISVATGTTTPLISIADAAFGTAGIVTSTGTQQFSGDKVFEGITQFNGRALFKDYTYTATRLAGLSSTDRFATVGIGTGLSLTSGTLSATGGSGTVTSVSAGSPANGLSVATSTTTPVISMALAGSGTIGVVSATTQTFGGNKTFTGTIDVSSTGTFGGRVNTPWLERQYTYSTSSSFTVSVNTSWLDINTSVLTTLTLPSAATYPGKELHIRQSGTGQLQSASSNVIPFTSAPTDSTGTAILNPTNNKAVTLVSDGVNWIIMQRSTN
jgi:hypothetical protein